MLFTIPAGVWRLYRNIANKVKSFLGYLVILSKLLCNKTL